MGSWNNNDGLFLEYGTTKATVENAGDYRTNGLLREIEVDIDLTTLTSTPTIISNTLRFPITMRIQEVQIVAHTAAVGSGATLDIGLVKADRTTELDYQAFVKGLAITAYDVAGESTTITAGSTGAGDLVGSVTTDVASYLTANYNTAAFTSGLIKVRIRYYGYGTIAY